MEGMAFRRQTQSYHGAFSALAWLYSKIIANLNSKSRISYNEHVEDILLFAIALVEKLAWLFLPQTWEYVFADKAESKLKSMPVDRKGKKVLGLIPARGGSKGVHRKNLVQLCGKPLISWVCEAAKRANVFDDLIVSTDDEEILSVARSLGVDGPFLRPNVIAKDETLIIDVILHALAWFKEHRGIEHDYVALLQPTAPLGVTEDFERAVERALESNADTVIAVYRASQHHPAIMYTVGNDGRTDSFVKSMGWNQMARRQDLPPVYMRSGIVYVFKANTLLQTRTLYGGTIFSIELPEERSSIDINTPFDLAIAEAALRHLGLTQER